MGTHDAAPRRSRLDLRSQRRGARAVGAGFHDQRQPQARHRRGGHGARCCSRSWGWTTTRRGNCTTTWSPRRPGSAYVQREVDLGLGEQIASLRLAGVNVDTEDKRVLPGGDTGRSVIGRTDIDGVGTAGLEKQYNDVLTGTAGELRKEVAPKGRSIAGSERSPSRRCRATTSMLTLDRSIQYAAEQALLGQRVASCGAKSGTIIVMDTRHRRRARHGIGAAQRRAASSRSRAATSPPSTPTSRARSPRSITIAAGAERGRRHARVHVRRAVAASSTPTTCLHDSHQHPDESMTVERDPHRVVEHRHDRRCSSRSAARLGQRTAEALRVHARVRPRRDDGARLPRRVARHPQALEEVGGLRASTPWPTARASPARRSSWSSAINMIANDGTYVAPKLVDGDGRRRRRRWSTAAPSATHEVVRPEVADADAAR